VTVDGASLVLPRGWELLPTSEADQQEYLAKMIETNPELEEEMKKALDSVASEGGVAMWAVSLELSSAERLTSANLAVAPNDGASAGALSDMGSAVTAGLEQGGASDIKMAEVDINGAPGLTWTYAFVEGPAARPIDMDGITYLVMGESKAAFLTVNSAAVDPYETADVIDDAWMMAQSLEVD
jgi:hypothetical protein